MISRAKTIFKEFIKKVNSQTKMGFSYLYKEYLRITGKWKGEFFITLSYADGRVETLYKRNIIVDSSSTLIARLLVDGQAAVDPSGPAHGIWVLAVGTGDASWDKQNPPAPTTGETQLVSELTRKRFSEVYFVKTDGSGLPAATYTNIIDFQTVFNESEAVGPLVEFGLFGGDADEGVANSGNMVNCLRFPVINKPNNATMSIIFRLTT